MYYVYMLRCDDNSIYTGITNNLERRMTDHFTRNSRCARYTLTHHARKLETAFTAPDRSTASWLEYQIKQLLKQEKEELISKGLVPDIIKESKRFDGCQLVSPHELPVLDKISQI